MENTKVFINKKYLFWRLSLIYEYIVLCCSSLPLFLSSLSSSQLQKNDYQLKMPSNQLIKKHSRQFSNSKPIKKSFATCPIIRKHNNKLNPEWVTGFKDRDGSFFVSITKNPELKVGWIVQESFLLVLHKRDIGLLEDIKNFFGVGEIYKHPKSSTSQFQVQLKKDLVPPP